MGDDAVSMLLGYEPPPEIALSLEDVMRTIAVRERTLGQATEGEDVYVSSVRRLLADLPEFSGEEIAALLLNVPQTTLNRHPAGMLLRVLPEILDLAMRQAMATCFTLGIELGREIERQSK